MTRTPALIVVDGFAGTGKSTSAQALWLDLARGGREASWLHEHEAGHPIVEYGEPEDLLRLQPDAFESRLLAGWQACVRDAAGPATRVIEGSFIQIPTGVMLAMNASAARIRATLRRIDAIAAGGGASLVYLFRPDLREALRQVGEERGPQWLEAMTAAVAQSPYGRAHRVRNVDGLVGFYQRQRAIVDEVFPTLTVRRLAIEAGTGPAAWDRVGRRVAAFVGVRRVPAVAQPAAALLRHAGPYRGAASGRAATITTDGRSLYLQLPLTPLLPLVRVGGGHFCPRSLPIDVRFAYDRGGRARSFAYESRMVNEVLTDTSWVRA